MPLLTAGRSPDRTDASGGAASDDPRDVVRLAPRLRGLAYRMLGDVADAEDVVQEGYLRWHRLPDAARAAVRSVEAWMVAATTRLAIDRLRRATAERARYVGPWLPAPVATPAAMPTTMPTTMPGAAPAATFDDLPAPDAADRATELASDLSVALLVLLERLAPDERAAFLLREVFGADYAEIARVLARSEGAARQVVHRARARVRAGRPRVAVPPGLHDRVLEQFLAALAAEDAPALLDLLAPGVVATSDGGGRVTAARRPVRGADRVARFLLGLARKGRGRTRYRLTCLNGRAAWLTLRDGRVLAATTLELTADGRVGALYTVLNPAKLGAVEGAPPVA